MASSTLGELWLLDKDSSFPGELGAITEEMGRGHGRKEVLSGPAPTEEIAATLALNSSVLGSAGYGLSSYVSPTVHFTVITIAPLH